MSNELKRKAIGKGHLHVISSLGRQHYCSMPSVTLKPDRVVRSRGCSGMGSSIAWHRRHNDSVD